MAYWQPFPNELELWQYFSNPSTFLYLRISARAGNLF